MRRLCEWNIQQVRFSLQVAPKNLEIAKLYNRQRCFNNLGTVEKFHGTSYFIYLTVIFRNPCHFEIKSSFPVALRIPKLSKKVIRLNNAAEEFHFSETVTE